MKLTIANLILAVAASVDGASLRLQKASADKSAINYGKILSSEVVLEGTVGEPTAEDMEFIGKALVASYNDVHWEVDHYMTGAHAVDFKGPEGFLCRHCPDDDAMGGAAVGVFEVRTPVGFLCRHCPDDDAMGAAGDSLLLAALTGDCAGLCKKDAAAELEVSFCNDVHWEVDHYMTGAHAVDFRGTPEGFLCRHCPDDDAMGGAAAGVFDVRTPVGFLCRHCPDDDAMGVAVDSLLLTGLTRDCAGLCHADAAAELEASFCDKVRSGARGSAYLASAKSCAIRFDADADASSGKAAPQQASAFVADIESTLILKGVGAGEATEEERAVLVKAFVSAYNDVHWDANHHLTDAKIAMIKSSSNDDPDGFLCRHCPDDDSMGGRAAAETNADPTSTMILDIVTPVEAFLCRHCPDDDAAGSAGFDSKALESDAFDRKALEVAFCSKIQSNPVSSKLATVRSCNLAIETVIV
eukprot:CAMPEP_0197195966 /NCGR_PEP_ID=MMETSP1423-20130617/32104_1 /TAXON_ID=476441 /ORGANISM="Pseudo-nitzschia heimii, Strain UNC1101" /LENGTH=468 /DNA_ID=CAMNT_0042649729 /DNA_START=100 /DNA_END=1507 /DNA_ORIENTATION=+